jgi:hypothetical protein
MNLNQFYGFTSSDLIKKMIMCMMSGFHTDFNYVMAFLNITTRRGRWWVCVSYSGLREIRFVFATIFGDIPFFKAAPIW